MFCLKISPLFLVVSAQTVPRCVAPENSLIEPKDGPISISFNLLLFLLVMLYLIDDSWCKNINHLLIESMLLE